MDERTDQPWVLGKALERAHWRCIRVAESERLLGYDESSRTYKDIAGELDGLASWVIQYKLLNGYLPAA